jgi:hypothetical protein
MSMMLESKPRNRRPSALAKAEKPEIGQKCSIAGALYDFAGKSFAKACRNGVVLIH